MSRQQGRLCRVWAPGSRALGVLGLGLREWRNSILGLYRDVGKMETTVQGLGVYQIGFIQGYIVLWA